MLRVENVCVYDLKESVIASRNAMRLALPEYTDEEFEKSLDRAKKLAKTPNGSGHQNFLKGIRVSFDVTYPQYWSMEFQRYSFADIVTSSSKMHRLTKMDIRKSCNKYVTDETIWQMEALVKQYNLVMEEKGPNSKEARTAFMKVISNCPMGLELFMRVSTNYLQLKTIVAQRKGHKLEDWKYFIEAMKELPYAKEFIFNE